MGHRTAEDKRYRRTRRLGRGRDQRGGALVEAAIITPILFFVIFALIDFGNFYNQAIQVRQAAAEGAREAAVTTEPAPTTGGSWSSSNCTTIGLQDTNGDTNITSGDGYDLVCYTKSLMGSSLSENSERVAIGFTAPFTAGSPVIVCVQYLASSITGSLAPFLNHEVVSSQTIIRIEDVNTSQVTGLPTFPYPVYETPINASNPWPTECQSPPAAGT